MIVQVQVPTNTCNLVPDFSWHADSSNASQIHFTNLSTPLNSTDSITWNFGDGSSSHDVNPSHIYTSPNTSYTVCLIVKKTNGDSCIRYICKVVTVIPVCNFTANFTWRADSSQPNKIYFTNTTIPASTAASATWSFGDGTTLTNWNAYHIYTQPGRYAVCLRVEMSAGCVRYKCDSITVLAPANCNLHSDFSFVRDSVQTNKVYFTNHSTGATANTVTKWYFGDGTFSYDNNPIHIYQASGAYTVCLAVRRDSLCANDTCKIVQVQVPTNTCNLVVNFSSTIDSIHSNLIHFTNLSTPISTTDSVTWYFGDGAASHDFLNASHTYTQGGAYNVCLVVKKNNSAGTVPCVREFCQRIIVDTPQIACNLVAYFSYIADSANHNKIYFTNHSTPLASTDSIRWTFGDGSSSADVNAIHTYNVAGTYTVCLRVKKVQTPGAVPCVSEYCKTIIIQPTTACNLVASFSFRADSIPATPLTPYVFENTSTPLTSIDSSFWDFGDNTPVVINPANPVVHVYTSPGVYVVCLKVKKVLAGTTIVICERQTCQTILVSGPPPIDSCNIHPGFITHLDSANRRKVYFTNTTVATTATTYSVWNFGDGTSGTGWNADHIYTMPGRYAVCLTVTRGNICTRTYCDSIFVPGNVIPPVNCDTFHLAFGHRQDDYMPNKLYFFATGNAPVYQQHWTFTNINNGHSDTVNQNNPVHVFGDTGVYRVCVRGYFSTACVKEYCDEVRIYSTISPTQCILNSYPNPAHNTITFNVQLDEPGIIAASVYNTQGILMMQYTQTGFTGNNPVTLNVENLPTGFYTVRIMYNGRVCYTRFQKI